MSSGVGVPLLMSHATKRKESTVTHNTQATEGWMAFAIILLVLTLAGALYGVQVWHMFANVRDSLAVR